MFFFNPDDPLFNKFLILFLLPRISVTQRAIHEALGKVFTAMKDKEQELLGIVKESVAQKKAALSDCENKIADRVTKYSEVGLPVFSCSLC